MILKNSAKNVVDSKRVSERVVIVKLEIETLMMNVFRSYAPQLKVMPPTVVNTNSQRGWNIG